MTGVLAKNSVAASKPGKQFVGPQRYRNQSPTKGGKMPERFGRRRIVAGAAGLLLVAVAAVVIVVMNRGGEDEPTAPQGADATQQPGRPVPALLEASDLPGDGWETTDIELVTLTDSPNFIAPVSPSLEACAPLLAFESLLYANENSFESGTSRSFARYTADGGVQSVHQSLVTFADADTVVAIMAAAGPALTDDDLPNCILAGIARDGFEATFEAGPALPVPADGIGRILRYRSTGATGASVTQAIAWWPEGQIILSLTISAAGSDFTDGELAAIADAAVTSGGDTP